MTIGIVGRKCGMTRVFTEAGESIPVTLIEAPNEIEEAVAIVNLIREGIAGGRRYSDFAVLYRANAQSRSIEEASWQSPDVGCCLWVS